MKIQWKITKKLGNIRPTLSYCFEVESFEKALALPPITIESTIPEPLDSWQEHCYPHQFERAEQIQYKGTYRLSLVSHKGKMWSQTLRLPWRQDNSYPEVEASFLLLREAFEAELARAHASKAMEESASLQLSTTASTTIAPSVLAEKFLHFAKRDRGESKAIAF